MTLDNLKPIGGVAEGIDTDNIIFGGKIRKVSDLTDDELIGVQESLALDREINRLKQMGKLSIDDAIKN